MGGPFSHVVGQHDLGGYGPEAVRLDPDQELSRVALFGTTGAVDLS
jgi:hypothetical protein